jgi:hypothetical protein
MLMGPKEEDEEGGEVQQYGPPHPRYPWKCLTCPSLLHDEQACFLVPYLPNFEKYRAFHNVLRDYKHL